ncbi:molybdate ABC transporter substrate-binding protein [Paracoccus sp. DMF-8]|uniref:molybdate ABC transporter substrate-binding protein n=1 Tax=Paracoccus sp. DMF-8 TaxID=3019445 RepID=UPI0023E39014|nr:molybdate ABC transporter substrate-binding protein [Paracoccus sp. DMF-8]MDF3607877.1 molybdate ABC transporter substrate-binding protein [Paracoccus sp. DMF-8]
MRLPMMTAIFCAFTAPAMADDITIFAAASLKDALDEIAADWEKTSGDKVTISYAGSSQLARQIQAGAPADLFISAAENWMDELEKSDSIDPATRTDLLGNTLVLVGAPDAAAVEITDLPAQLGDAKLAMALVDSVPAGQYGKEALTSLGIWDALEPHVAQADNVRAALALVAAKEAPYGIVYATDAVAEPDVSVLATFPADSHKPIIYPAAVLKDATAADDAGAFLTGLREEPARKVLEGQGFTILP